MKCPRRADGAQHFVFPNGAGKVDLHANIITRGLIPTMIDAGVTAPVLDNEGKPVRGEDGKSTLTAKYTGLHALRGISSRAGA